jgi:hypothetical protein
LEKAQDESVYIKYMLGGGCNRDIKTKIGPDPAFMRPILMPESDVIWKLTWIDSNVHPLSAQKELRLSLVCQQ